ncbi:MAG: tRNA (adenosine(37)-N6)-threonylcarbamoyltransferase complex dimerization subunit type 1 TsaB [Alphaproteobacteria bacterium]
MLGLAIDSAHQRASAALWRSGRDAGSADKGAETGPSIVDSAALSPDDGKADQLINVIERLLSRQGLDYGDLDLLAVNRGPGSFTGIRSAVALARGLALAAGLPVLGVTSHEALMSGLARDQEGRRTLIAEDARRGEVYVQAFDAAGVAATPIQALAIAAAAGDVRRGAWRFAGSGAGMIAAALPADVDVHMIDIEPVDAVAVARAAARGLAEGDMPAEGFRLRPLYVRAPDAVPPTPLIDPAERVEVPA